MRENEAEKVVAALRRRGVVAGVARPGTYRFGVRVPLPDGREVLWDVDGAAGLEAQVMRDGVLVGFVPQIPGTDGLDAEGAAGVIRATRYPD